MKCSLVFFMLLLLMREPLSSSPGQQIITALFGTNVTLYCQVPSNVTIGAVKMTKSDEEEYICLYIDGHKKPGSHDRPVVCMWTDSDGTMLVVLPNVTSSYNDIYNCWYKDDKGGEFIQINSTTLNVVEDYVRIVAAVLSVPAVVLIVVVVLIVAAVLIVVGVCKYKKHKRQHTDLASASEDNSLNKGVCSKLLAWMSKQRKKPESGPDDPEKATMNTDSSEEAAGVFVPDRDNVT